MSEQRKLRAELRQGLHQFLMQLYMSYTQTLDKKTAIEQIVEVLNEQHEYFTGQAMQLSGGSEEELTKLLKTLEDKSKNALTEYDRMTVFQQYETVQETLEILKQERGNVNG